MTTTPCYFGRSRYQPASQLPTSHFGTKLPIRNVRDPVAKTGHSADSPIRLRSDTRYVGFGMFYRFRLLRMSIPLRGPVTRASHISCVAAPCPAARVTGESARTRGVFVLDCY
jgi:hypothetical protein